MTLPDTPANCRDFRDEESWSDGSQENPNVIRSPGLPSSTTYSPHATAVLVLAHLVPSSAQECHHRFPPTPPHYVDR